MPLIRGVQAVIGHIHRLCGIRVLVCSGMERDADIIREGKIFVGAGRGVSQPSETNKMWQAEFRGMIKIDNVQLFMAADIGDRRRHLTKGLPGLRFIRSR